MATTHTRHTKSPQRAYERGQYDRSSYAAVWGILALAMIGAVAYGHYSSERHDLGTMPATQAGELTPSIITPGVPDTTTTESTSIPIEGVHQ